MEQQEKIKVLYILGAGRSGSTLISNLLGQLEGFVSVGELFYIWERGFQENRLCGCGQTFDKCVWWSRVLSESEGIQGSCTPAEMLVLQNAGARSRHIPWMLTNRGFQHIKKKVSGYQQTLENLYATISNHSTAQVIVDASKFPSYAFWLMHSESIDLYIVHLVRDARAVAFSWQRKKFNPDSNRQFGQINILKSSAMWLTWNVTAELFVKRMVDKTHYQFIRYQDFINDPQKALRELCDFLHVSVGDMPISTEKMVRLVQQHTIAGNPVRFSDQPVPLIQDLEWISKMKFSHKLAVTLLTWPLLLKYRFI